MAYMHDDLNFVTEEIEYDYPYIPTMLANNNTNFSTDSTLLQPVLNNSSSDYIKPF